VGLVVVEESPVAKFRNVSGVTLEIPSVGKVVDDDGVFEVPDELVPGFECQPSNYERLDADVDAKKASK
jgi:hypothetical protein